MANASTSYSNSSSQPEGTKTIIAVLGMLLALGAGYLIGSYKPWHFYGDGGTPTTWLGPDTKIERFKVPVGGSPALGPSDAKVTIITFSDYQCPYCGRAEATMQEVLKNYPKEVRVVFKNNPLPFHAMALPAARATLAAREQGEDKFWKYHSFLFQNQEKLTPEYLEEAAKSSGLNVEKFKTDLSQNQTKYDAEIHADQAEAGQFGAQGTPTFFINGRLLSGAQPYDNFKKVIEEEIEIATQALKSGVKPENLYAALIQKGKERTEEKPPSPAKPPVPFQLPDPKIVYKVAVGNAPIQGTNPAKVTIVEYSDFQCPFCSRAKGTMDQVLKTYPKDVRLVFKQNPLPFHANAQLAAEAALAANEQGKFWQMHDQMFAHQNALDRASLEKYANDLGLDMTKFKGALDSGKFKSQIAADLAEGARLGVHGTPAFFVNGKPIRGARPFEDFQKLIERELSLADEKLKAGVKLADLYDQIIKEGLEKAPESEKPAQANSNEGGVVKAVLGEAPVQGPMDARVTIVEFSDFQCPFCSRVVPSLKQVLTTYPKDVRIAFKQYPLPMHQNAHLAAEAALAAKEQGKFWEMHDKLFANQGALDRASLEKYAQELGLDMNRFRLALDQGKFKSIVDQETAEGNKLGVSGTPTLFINGKRVVGAVPFEQLKTHIEQAIKDADTLMKQKNVAAAKVYDEIMKTAQEGGSAPSQNDPGPSKTVFKVEAGNGPSFGPASAPVTIVEFSDFQCPFCSKVLPTIKQIKEKYPNQVRIAFRNYPLPMHPNAPLAAEAALAAHAQGKFWEMHDQLFTNQGALDRVSLEKYAATIGLNVDQFKADLDSGKYKAAVQADVQYANSVSGGGMGTPTFFINGHKIEGAYPFETFDQAIQTALSEAKQK